MSTNQPINQVAEPALRDLLNAHKAEIFGSLNCHQIGKIVSFDSAKQTASVQISISKQVVDYTKTPAAFVNVPYPLLTDCPVYFGSGGNSRLTFPVVAGDPCVVLFNDRDLDNWFAGSAQTPANSDRKHDLSDGLVIVGFRNVASALASFYTAGVEIGYHSSYLRLADKVALNGLDSTLRAVLEAVVTALTALNAKTGPSAGTQITAVTTEINKLLQ